MKSNVVLLLFFLSNNNSLWGVNSFVHFESQKVLNFNSLTLNIFFTFPLSMMLTTIGKWEYAKTILNLYPLVTPLTMFLMVDLTVPRTAFLFFFWSHILNLIDGLPFLFLSLTISKGICLNDLVRVPSFPFTVTVLDLISTVTPSGISNYCSETIYFIITQFIYFLIKKNIQFIYKLLYLS